MKNKEKIKGFTIIECVIAMVIVVVGFTSIFSLLVFCVRTEVISRELSQANSQARLKMEQLKVSARNPGGSLTNNATNYFDNPLPRYTRRWQISADAMGSQTITILMSPNGSGTVLSEVRLVTRMK